MNADTPDDSRLRDRWWLLIMLGVVAITALVFAWNSMQLKSGRQEPGAWLDDNGRLHVLGLILDQTTLREAETRLKSRSDVALYIYPKGHPKAGITLEAYFPSIADHTRVILLLDADIPLLHDIEKRATRPHLYPNSVARMNIAAQDHERALSLPIHALTLIPSARITPEDLKARFGKPDSSKKNGSGDISMTYRSLGLTATLSQDGTASLYFTTPRP